MDSMSNDLAARLERAKAALAEKPDGVVEAIASTSGTTPADVLSILPAGAAVMVPASHFADIWTEMGAWGEVLMIVHTEDIVFEVVGTLPQVPKATAGSTFMAIAPSAVTSARTAAYRSLSWTACSMAAAPVPSGS